MDAIKPGYTRAEKTNVLASTMLGYALDFYNILIIAFLMGPIQKALGITLTEAGVITSVTLIGSVLGGILFRLAGRPHRTQEFAAVDPRTVLGRGHPVGLRLEFPVDADLSRHYRHWARR